jgi:hypothetical protein
VHFVDTNPEAYCDAHILALPSLASTRFSKCATRSAATSAMRFGSPTSASSAAHFVFRLMQSSPLDSCTLRAALRSVCLAASHAARLSFFVSSSPSVISSNSASIFGSSAAFRLNLEMRLS